MNQELIRIIDGLARDKNIDRETVFEDLEAAMYTAIRKAHDTDEIVVKIDRQDGTIKAVVDGSAMSMRDLGRIAAQTAKQVMIQRIRESERGSIYEEYLERRGQIVTGKVGRWERGSLLVDLGRVEASLPKGEQIPGDTHRTDERIRAMILDVNETSSAVRVVLSRTHPDFIKALFELEVPEVAEHIIEVKALAREAGYRTKVAVISLDAKVDAVGACVGMRGSRIKNIVDELGGEKVDIVRWNDSSKILIGNALKPAEVSEIALSFELGRATVVVSDDQLSLAIGKRGQNVRLAARLSGWDIDILTPKEYNLGLDGIEHAFKTIEGVDATAIDKIVAMGMINVLDVEEVGIDPLVNEIGLSAEIAKMVLAAAGEEAKRHAAAKAQAKKDAAAKAQAKKDAAQAENDQAQGDTDEQISPEASPADGEQAEGEQKDDTPADVVDTPASDTPDSETQMLETPATEDTPAPETQITGEVEVSPQVDELAVASEDDAKNE